MENELTSDELALIGRRRSYIRAVDGQNAFDLLLEAALHSNKYKVDPPAKKKSIELRTSDSHPYGFMVTQSDILFYYRKPSGFATPSHAEYLKSLGLNVVGISNDGHLRVRIANPKDAHIVVDDCFPVPLGVTLPRLQILEAQFEEAVDLALQRPVDECAVRLATASKVPQRVEVATYAFVRNADVVAMVLRRAAGLCEECSASAPFLRRKDGTPYLEVHHRKPLADGGEDSVANAIAVCPNCHRQKHYG